MAFWPERRDGADEPDAIEAAVAAALAMVADGADILDIGGESTRPGHAAVSVDVELGRVVPVVAAVRRALPDVAVSVDTTKPAVAEAALAAGADLVNDVWGVGPDDGLAASPRHTARPLVVMHNRAEPRYVDLVPEVIADLRAALERAVRLGVAWDAPDRRSGLRLRQDARAQSRDPPRAWSAPGAGPADPAGHITQVDPGPGAGTSRPTSASRRPWRRPSIGIAEGADIVRVHDVRANVRAARMSDAIVRGTWHDARDTRRSVVSDRIVLAEHAIRGADTASMSGSGANPSRSRWTSSSTATCAAPGSTTTWRRTIDYGPVYATVKRIVEGASVRLLEALAEAIADALLADLDVTEVVVRVRKPGVRLGGPLDYAGVEIRRTRADPRPPPRLTAGPTPARPEGHTGVGRGRGSSAPATGRRDASRA